MSLHRATSPRPLFLVVSCSCTSRYLNFAVPSAWGGGGVKEMYIADYIPY